MGTWNTSINGNDAFLDIYSKFYELYDEKVNPDEISGQLFDEFKELFDDVDDRNNALFGLALAQWETKSQDAVIFEQVREIIESGNDIEVWKELGADDKMLKKRSAVLDKFLLQIAVPREKPKRRVRPKLEYEYNEIVDITSPNGAKNFKITEMFVNKKYSQTTSTMRRQDGAGLVICFIGEGKFVNAKWIHDQILEIEHDKDIKFIRKDDASYLDGDEVKIIYKPR